MHAADLYLVAALSCGLLSVASFDLAIWPAASEQSRATYVYAELIDHRSLQAWARGQQALIAFWSGRPQEAANLAMAGLDLGTRGTPRARLHSIAARAWSHLGAVDRAKEALIAAEDEREAIGDLGTDDVHDRISGQFGWGPARQAMCMASAWLRMADASQAATQARLALRAWPQDPTGTQVDIKASTDLATAELDRGQLDAAGDALGRVWDLEPSQRRHAVTSRLDNVEHRLTAPDFRDAAEARTLRERIEAFTADTATDTAVRALPSHPSGDPTHLEARPPS